MEPRFIDDLAKRLMDNMPDSVRSLQDDLESNFKSVLQSALTKMNLVSREEFDVQTAVLQRTREKLEGLIARLAEFEEQLDDKQ